MRAALASALAARLEPPAEGIPPAIPASPFAPSTEQIAAAVLVLLDSSSLAGETAAEPVDDWERLSRLRVVLTRRRADLPHHAGEISFPGGRQDPDDRTLLETALRESAEEIGLDRARARVLGALPFVHTFSTNYAVRPFVALLEPAVTRGAGQSAGAPVTTAPAGAQPQSPWSASRREVDAILEVTLGELAESREQVELTRHGVTFRTPAFALGAEIVWGLTERVIAELLHRLQGGG